MIVTIIYNTDFRDNAGSLKAAVMAEWSDASVNMLGIRDTLNGAKYQIQHDGGIVYSSTITTNNTTIINSIKERL